MISNEKLLEYLIVGEYMKVKEGLEGNILESDLPKDGVKELSFVKRYMKTVERDDMKGIITENEKYYICNGYSLVEVSKKFDYKDATSKIIPRDLFPDIRDFEEYEFDYKEVINTLKVLKVKYKKDKKEVFKFNEDVGVNPVYLFEILSTMGKDTKIWLGEGTNPIYLETGIGRKAILLPVYLR